MKKLVEWNALSGQLTLNNIVGSAKGMWVTFRGTAQAAQNAVISDVSEIRIDTAKRKGIVAASMQRLAQRSAFKGGRIGDRANTGGAFFFQCYIPFTIEGDDNCYYLTGKDECNLTVKFAASLTGTVYATAIVTVHLDIAEGLHKYWVNIDQITEGSLTASSTSVVKEYKRENLVEMFITPRTNINNLQVKHGGVVQDATFEEWRNTGFYMNAIETVDQEAGEGDFGAGTAAFTLNAPDMANIRLAGHGSYSEILEDDVTLTFATGGSAPTPDILFVHLDFDENKLDESQVYVNSQFNSRKAGKVAVGKSRPVRVVNKLQSAVAL